MKHKTQTKRLLSLMLALCMVISMFSGLTLMASAADETWTPVALADVQPTDVIVIVATKSDGATYAMTNDKGTAKAPAAQAITVTDGKLTSVAENLKWNVTQDETKYKFNPAGDVSKYLYCTGTNNGVRIGTNTNNQFTLHESGYLQHVATERYIGVYSAQDWRCYTDYKTNNIKDQTFTFYKLAGAEPEPGKVNINVTVDPAEAGSYTADADLTNVAPGGERNLTFTENAGYELTGVTVNGITENDYVVDLAEKTLYIMVPAEQTEGITVTANYSKKEYTIEQYDDTAEYTITATPSTATVGDDVTLTVDVPEGKMLTSLGYYDDAANYTELTTSETTVTFKMPAFDIYTYAELTDIRDYVVTFNNMGEETTATVSQADPYLKAEQIPETSNVGEFVFVGWTTEDTFDAEPKDFPTTSKITEDITLYAVYAKETSSGGSGDYVKVTENLEDWSGQYVIACEAKNCIFNGHAVDETFNNIGVTFENNRIKATDDVNGAAVEIESMGGATYSIKTPDGDYLTRNSGKLASSPNPVAHTIKLDGTNVKLAQGTYYIQFNGNSDQLRFRYYTKNQQPVQLYKLEGGTSRSDFTRFPTGGGEETLPDWVIASDIVLNYDLKMSFDVVDYKALAANHPEIMIMDLSFNVKEDSGLEVTVAGSPNYYGVLNPLNFVSLGKTETVECTITYVIDGDLDHPKTCTKKITVKAASIVYCEESSDMFSYEPGKHGEWNFVFDDTTPVEEQFFTGDESDRNELYDDCAKYSAGTACKTTVSLAEKYPANEQADPTVSFSFSGTGFELISASNSISGVFIANVDGVNYLVDTYYGLDEEKNPDIGDTVYQAPVIRVEGLTHGTHNVTITPKYAPMFDYLEYGEFEFIVDGLRVFDPLGETRKEDRLSIRDALVNSTTNQITYIDGNGNATQADVATAGSAYEVFLAKDQTIAFKLTADEAFTDFSIGARAMNGTPANMEVYVVENDATFDGSAAPTQTVPLATATQMHYSVSCDANSKVVVIRNTGDGILALGDVRVPAGKNTKLAFNDATLTVARRLVKTLIETESAFNALTDVPADKWYYNSVKFVVDNKLMVGVGDNKFAPEKELTRAMAVRILFVLAGTPEATAQDKFTDVPADAWYADAVAWGAENGIVAGVSETKFNPNGKLSRQQMVTFLYRYAGEGEVVEDKLAEFTDGAATADYAVNAMNWAIANGIVSGMGNGTVAPNGIANRAQMASILASCDVLFAD